MIRMIGVVAVLLILAVCLVTGCTTTAAKPVSLASHDTKRDMLFAEPADGSDKPVIALAQLSPEEQKTLSDDRQAAVDLTAAFNKARRSEIDGMKISEVSSPLTKIVKLSTKTDCVTVQTTGPAAGQVTVAGQRVTNGQVTAIKLPAKTDKVEVTMQLAAKVDPTDSIVLVHLVAGNYQHWRSPKAAKIRVLE